MSYRVLICGGGSTYTLPMIKMICDSYSEFPVKEIILLDIDETKTNPIFEASEIIVKNAIPDAKVKVIYSNDNIPLGVDFAFMQIRSGGLKMREYDEKIPLKYNCVGQETCGAGGFAYGLRSIKDIVDLITAIRKKSEQTWIINYSNPAAIVAEATKRFFPNDKRLMNLCDMPIAMLDGFAQMLNKTRDQLSPRYFGLNHFGWFTHIYDENGVDRLSEIKDKLKTSTHMPEELKNDSGWQHTFAQLSIMLNDLEGFLPNTYMQYYLYPNKSVLSEDKNYTRANYVMEHREKEVYELCNYIIKNKTIEGSSLEKGVHGKYIIELATSIINNQNKIFLALVKNNGIISNFSSDAVVEVPCIVNANGFEPLHVGEIPTFYKGLMESQYAYEKLTVDAFENNSYDLALKALILNRTIVDTEVANQILDELIKANKDYWTQLN